MSPRSRHALFLIGAIGTGAVLVPALIELGRVTEFSDLVSRYYLQEAVAERRSYNVVSSVIFDYRGFDTLFEQLIMFAAVVGVALLLRVQSGEVEREPQDARPGREVPSTAPAIRFVGVVLAGSALLIAVYIILAVHVTPGGGFQSGVLIAGGLLAVYLADDYHVYDRLTPVHVVERVEAVAAGTYMLIALVGLVVGGSLLSNFLPLGNLGGLYAGGTIWALNLVVAVEVTAGFVLIFTEFLQQSVLIRERSGR